MSGVQLLRLDRAGGRAPGNKSFKLRPYVDMAVRRGVRRLVSFGGPWSNHLHALAATGRECGLATVGIVRGLDPADTAMLQDARAWGMTIVRVSRGDYRRRNEAACQAQLRERFGPCLLVPEGGAGSAGAGGCIAMADLVMRCAPAPRTLVLPVGTATTLAGLVAGLYGNYTVIGVSALKGAADLEARAESLLSQLGRQAWVRWSILHDHHCGGFARVDNDLRDFMLAFEGVQGVPLDPVYTGKAMLAIWRLLQSGELDPGVPVLAIHTGGLQGRRGYPWLQGP